MNIHVESEVTLGVSELVNLQDYNLCCHIIYLYIIHTAITQYIWCIPNNCIPFIPNTIYFLIIYHVYHVINEQYICITCNYLAFTIYTMLLLNINHVYLVITLTFTMYVVYLLSISHVYHVFPEHLSSMPCYNFNI